MDEDLYAARPDLMLTGKHNNWSLGTDTGTLLLAPGKDAKGNLQFVTFFVNVLVRIMLMYYIDVQGFLEHPEKDWEESLSAMMESPPEPVETEK